MYRAFQFKHSKSNNYFKGRDGKKNYLNAVIWVLTEKAGLDLNYIDFYKSNGYFLNTRYISFYGLGQHAYKHIFNSVEEIKNELVRLHGNRSDRANEKTDKLRRKLIEENFQFNCSVKNCCHTNPEVHHIIPKGNKKGLEKYKIEDFDDVDNLVFCALIIILMLVNLTGSPFLLCQVRGEEKCFWMS